MPTQTLERKQIDSEIHGNVIEELKWDTRVNETTVGVEVDDQVVTLTGTVDTYAEKAAARDAALRVPSVRDVANDIKVRIPGDDQRTDTDIAHVVRRALEWNVTLPADQIKTTVSEGWITLDGTAATVHQREEAERTVRHLAGVRGVVNRITVVPAPADPVLVQAAIEKALVRHAEREAQNISVRLREGVVTLSGCVSSWRDKRAVLGVAAHAPGVKQVVDELAVEGISA